MKIEEFKIKVYWTKEHYISEADEIIDDVFHTEILYTEASWDLMYRKFAFRIEVFNKLDMFVPIRVFEFKHFNRKKYKESFGSEGEYGKKGIWKTKEEEELKTNKWNKNGTK